MSSENERILRAAKGDETAFAELLTQYGPLIRAQSRRFAPSFTSSDGSGLLSEEDVVQEARVAFYRAVCTYDVNVENVTFGLYAKVCIRNALVSELRRLRAASRTKRGDPHAPHETTAGGPDERRESAQLRSRIESLLSPYEKTVFSQYLSGRRAGEIAADLGRTEKSVYNALFRIRTKIRASRGTVRD